ncbi:hypothetical protein [Blautia massiliensis (ex Durand et al. 2017)]|uniref:hypothetical protein n=1 Tax=Blautia massiliensis (ex Durand et al. 2017) TaxID=1737424 RepID=UPI00189FA288|nr:hypothetical protein [Blautia massiliensis (ex Durand et al. 2017)]
MLSFLLSIKKEVIIQMVLTLITLIGKEMFTIIIDKTFRKPQILVSFGTSDRDTMYVSKTGCYIEPHGQIEKTLNVKINIQVINNTSVNKLMRDINLYAYYKGKEVAKLKLVKISVIDGCEKISDFGQPISHSELVPSKAERNIKLWSKLESTTDNDNKTDIKYDEIRFGYCDIRGKKRRLHLLNIDEDSCWKNDEKETPEEPIRIL